MATTLRVMELEVRCDSLLIVSQVNGEYAAKDGRMAAYLKVVTAWRPNSPIATSNRFRDPRTATDSLAMLASVVDFQFRREIPVEHTPKPNIHKPDEEIFRLDRSPGWRDPSISFLKDETLPKDKVEA